MPTGRNTQLDHGLFGLDRSPSNRKVGRVHWEAGRDFTPRVYRGRIVVFVAQQHAAGFTAAGNHDVTLGWGRRRHNTWRFISPAAPMPNSCSGENFRF